MTQDAITAKVRGDFDAEALLDTAYQRYRDAKFLYEKHGGQAHPRRTAVVSYSGEMRAWAEVIYTLTGMNGMDWQSDPRAKPAHYTLNYQPSDGAA